MKIFRLIFGSWEQRAKRSEEEQKLGRLMLTNLPEKVLVKILSRLPPKYIIRLKCVSKTWHGLIGHPDFLFRYLINHSIILNTQQNPNQTLLLVKIPKEPFFERLTSTVCQNHQLFSLLSYETLDCMSQIALPLHLKLVASCKGLLCLHSAGTQDVYLWNPATPGLKALPPVTCLPYNHLPDLFGYRLRLGFGFDSRSNDFKVVSFRRIKFQKGRIMISCVEVYSLSGGSWRVLDLPMPIPVSPRFLLYAHTLALDGVFIWWMSGHDIIVFDFSNEVFRTMPLPRLLENCDRSITITSLNGHVALLAFSSSEINPKWYSELEIWVLLEFGVQESWTRVTTIGLPMNLTRPQ